MDWGGIGAVGGLVLVLVGSLLRLVWVAAILTHRVEENTAALNRNARHLDGIMAAYGPLIWRLATMEDWLEQNHGYHPPRDITINLTEPKEP